MQKIHVHIANEFEFIDSRVFVEIILPAIPRKGEIIYLTTLQKRELEKKASKNLNIAQEYSPKWFYGNSYNCDELKEENLKDLSFDDAINVSSVAYCAGEDIVHVELDL